ncbi:MAG: hypothetical protein ACJARK_001398, partial [Marinobacter psychrophilus]
GFAIGVAGTGKGTKLGMYWRHSPVVMCQKMANSQSTIKTQAALN